MFDSSFDDSVYRQPPASYAYTPTFLERTNISGSYGDNAQDFYLTVSQADWSHGEGQRFFRGSDADRARRYWQGHSIDPVSVPGQVSMTRGIATVSPAGDIVAACPIPGTPSSDAHAFVSGTHLYFITGAGSITDKGTHGAGTVLQWGICRDSAKSPKVYIAGSSKIVRWSEAANNFADFSATAAAGTLAFLNNVLYSCDGSTLNSYDTSGVKTTIYTWRDAQGSALAVNTDAVRLVGFGGDLLIWFPQMEGRPQLWKYDGTSTFIIADFPQSVIGYDCLVLDNIVFLSGVIQTQNPTSPATADAAIAAIWALNGGSIAEVWRSTSPASSAAAVAASVMNPALGTYGGKLIFFDAAAGNMFNSLGSFAGLKQYDIATGAVTLVALMAVPTGSSGNVQITSKVQTILLSFNGAYSGSDSAFLWPDATSLANSGSVLVTSMFDFDNSLQKVFRSFRVDWEGGGSGGTVDISYAVDQLVTSSVGSWTSLQSSAVSGTEYLLPANTTGHEIQFRLTMNKPASGAPATVKRIYSRAAPVLQSYRNNKYILDCSGNKFAPQPSYINLANGYFQDLDGVEMVTNLRTAIAAGVVSVTDRYGTFNGIIEPAATTFREIRSGYGRAEYRVELTVREV